MDEKEALAFLKRIVDQAVGAGMFKRTEDVVAATQALQILQKKIKDDK